MRRYTARRAFASRHSVSALAAHTHRVESGLERECVFLALSSRLPGSCVRTMRLHLSAPARAPRWGVCICVRVSPPHGTQGRFAHANTHHGPRTAAAVRMDYYTTRTNTMWHAHGGSEGLVRGSRTPVGAQPDRAWHASSNATRLLAGHHRQTPTQSAQDFVRKYDSQRLRVWVLLAQHAC